MNSLKFKFYHYSSFSKDYKITFMRNKDGWRYGIQDWETLEEIKKHPLFKNLSAWGGDFSSRSKALEYVYQIYKQTGLPLPSNEIVVINSYKLSAPQNSLIDKFLFAKRHLVTNSLIETKNKWTINFGGHSYFKDDLYDSWGKSGLGDIEFSSRKEAALCLLEWIKLSQNLN